MPVETVKIYREVEFDIDADGAIAFSFLTEMPGSNLAVRHTASFDTEATSTGEIAVNVRMKGEVKGKLASIRLTGSTARVYAARVCFRYVGSNSSWQWASIPIPQTSAVYQAMSLGLPSVSKRREWVNLQIDEV